MSTITDILGGDSIKDSRAVINTNFDNLNTDLVAAEATIAAQIPTANQKAALAGASGTPSVSDKYLTETYFNTTKAPSVQTFLADGTYTMPTGVKTLLVRAWGAGGSGGSTALAVNEAGGGGGGGYMERWFQASDISSPVTVTVGTGGVGVSGEAAGNVGENTTFGSYITAYGGGGGGTSGTGGGGGGGAGLFGAGGTASGASAGAAGAPGVPFGAIGGTGSTATVKAIYGGGGGSGQSAGNGLIGGDAFYGGAGGGGATSGLGAAGGTSNFGGAGGSGITHASTSATAGSVPGGGGGAKHSSAGTGSSGAGGDGKVIVYEFYV